MEALSRRERQLLGSTTQRPRLFAAPFGQFKLKVMTVKRDATKERKYQKEDWRPILNIGPHRLTFVGEPITFDAQDSYKMMFDHKKKRVRAHTQGYGAGEHVGKLNWRIKKWGTLTPIWHSYGQDWEEEQTWTPTEAGLYELTCVPRGWSINGDVEKIERLKGKKDKKDQAIRANHDATARRWIRVYDSRDDAHWNVTGIEGLTGTWGEGWSCTLTLQTTDIELSPTGIEDYQTIGIYCEDNWYVGPDNVIESPLPRFGTTRAGNTGVADPDLLRFGHSHFGDPPTLPASEVVPPEPQEAAWVTHPIGHIRQEPRVVMIGYVKEGSIKIDHETKSVTLTLESVVGQMDRSMTFKVAIWNADGPGKEKKHDKRKHREKHGGRRRSRKRRHNGSEGSGGPNSERPTPDDEPEKLDEDADLEEDFDVDVDIRDIMTRDEKHRKRHRRRHRRKHRSSSKHEDRKSQRGSDDGGGGKGGKDTGGSKEGGDNWGAVLRGFGRVCIADFALWFLMFKTNLLEHHDYYSAWNDKLADLESIAGEESSVLSVLQTVADNDWYVVGAQADNSIYFAPDRQVIHDDDWEEYWPTRMTLKDKHIMGMNLTRQHENPIKYVKLTATKTADFQSKAKTERERRKDEKKNQLEAWYPSKHPPIDQPGTWFVRSDLLHDTKRVLFRRAKEVYQALNRNWTGTLDLALNRALGPGHLVTIDSTGARRIWGERKRARTFLVRTMSAEIDVDAMTWMTTLEVEEWNPEPNKKRKDKDKEEDRNVWVGS